MSYLAPLRGYNRSYDAKGEVPPFLSETYTEDGVSQLISANTLLQVLLLHLRIGYRKQIVLIFYLKSRAKAASSVAIFESGLRANQ